MVGSNSMIEPHRVLIAPEDLERVCARRRILVSLQNKGDPRAALETGRVLASAFGVSLHGLFAWHAPLSASEVPALIGVEAAELGGLVIDVEMGETVDCLAAAAEAEPGTILVIPADFAGDTPLGLSDTATRALFEFACGVVVVRPGMAPLTHISRILLPLDGTPSTAAAIGPVGALARHARAEIAIVVVAEAHGARCERGSMKPPLYVDQPHHEWQSYADEFLQRFVQAIGHMPEGVSTRFFVGAGDPASEILRFARELEADLAVLVWHGDAGEPHGHVFREVLEGSRCPVLVLRR
jgi:nucleotide-binding universal stress UspA family protein